MAQQFKACLRNGLVCNEQRSTNLSSFDMNTEPTKAKETAAELKIRLTELVKEENAAKRAAKLAKLHVRAAKSRFKEAKRRAKALRQQVKDCQLRLEQLPAAGEKPKTKRRTGKS